MLYQYNAEDYEKPISFISPSGKSYVKEYNVRNEYNVGFNSSTIVKEYDDNKIVILIVGNPTEKNKFRFRSIISNFKLEKVQIYNKDNSFIYFKLPDKK